MPRKPPKTQATLRQRDFAAEYIRNRGDATAAYRHAYRVGKGTTQATVNNNANVTRRHPAVAAIIEEHIEAQRRMTRDVAELYGMDKQRLVREMAALVNVRMSDFVRPGLNGEPILTLTEASETHWGAVQEINQTVMLDRQGHPAGIRTKLRLYDRRAAAETIARLNGWIVETRNVRVIRSVEDLSDDELAVLAAAAPDESPDPDVEPERN